MRISSFSVPALESRVTPGNGGIAKFWDSSWLQGRASRDLAPNLYSWLGGKTRKSGMICITKTGLSTMSTADEMAEFVMLWSLVQEVVLFFFFDDENKKWSSMTGKMKSGGNGLKMDSIPHNQHTKLSSLAPAVLIAGRCGRPKWKTSMASSYGYKCSANS